ncbi:uncharacterized protein EAE98_009784 [Botrytis deweyae]|uniref:Uncharacterized protein n=1 Tax=Botrytis deweyae TaxID=2478750 RepID=A0ABQ7IBK7_9HELO|nr:uncharacterized protein EAE98_009784 [Botrytis deweyae]KAF7918541.1 hypothetical protein EAE98_009784 [Botrytis deweyae]
MKFSWDLLVSALIYVHALAGEILRRPAARFKRPASEVFAESHGNDEDFAGTQTLKRAGVHFQSY